MASISPQRPVFPVRLAAGAAAALVLLGAGLAVVVGLASPAAASSHAVMIEQYAYLPASLTIDQGDTVTWTNHDTVQHDVTVTSGPATFHSPLLAKGQSWSFTFGVAGSYSYICSVHPDMRASVTVSPKATAAPKATVTKAAPVAPAATPTAATPAKAPKATAAAPPAATGAAAPPAASEQIVSVPAAASTPTLDPLLIVAGVSTAVMVFCLLLMSSRPVAVATATKPDSDPDTDPDVELVAEPVAEPVDV